MLVLERPFYFGHSYFNWQDFRDFHSVFQTICASVGSLTRNELSKDRLVTWGGKLTTSLTCLLSFFLLSLLLNLIVGLTNQQEEEKDQRATRVKMLMANTHHRSDYNHRAGMVVLRSF